MNIKSEIVEPKVDNVQAPSEDKTVIPFSDIRPRLARGGWGSGGNGSGGSSEEHTNYLKYAPEGAMIFVKKRGNKNNFVIDQYVIYKHMPRMTALDPVIPGVNETGVWWVDQQAFCNNYEHYATVEHD